MCSLSRPGRFEEHTLHGLAKLLEQRARERTPQLGAGGPLREREWNALSDKDLQPMIDNAIEDGLSPGGLSGQFVVNCRKVDVTFYGASMTFYDEFCHINKETDMSQNCWKLSGRLAKLSEIVVTCRKLS